MDDTSSRVGRHRSLTVNQTLDEILGIDSKNDSYGINSIIRPPTRHGRESASSEENKDPTPTEITNSPNIRESFSNSRDSMDDGFLFKLQEMRKRNQIEKRETSSEKKLRDVNRQRTGIEEEDIDDDESNNNMRKSKNFLKIDTSRPTTSENLLDNHTFRIEEDDVKEDNLKEKQITTQKADTTKKNINLLGNRSNSLVMNSSEQHKIWLQKKLEQEKTRKKLEKEKEEKEKKMKEEKKRISAKQFELWKQTREQQIAEQSRLEKQKNMEQKKKDDEAKKQKQLDAQKTFKAWKAERLRAIENDKFRAKGEEEELQRRKKREEKIKKTEAQQAFEAWAKQKEEEEDMRRIVLEKQLAHERKKIETELEMKELLAEQAYQTWLELKEIEKQLEFRSPSAMSNISCNPVPWVPPSNTVPRHFVSSGTNRRRSLDRRNVKSTNRLQRSYSAKNVYLLK